MEVIWFPILLICLLTFFIFVTVKIRSEKVVSILLLILALIILPWKIIEFSYYAITKTGTYPIEISHISYFVFGVIVLFGIKKLFFTAGIFSFISALGYIVGGVASPSTGMETLEFHIFIMGIISHFILLFGGLLLLFKVNKYNLREFYIPVIAFVLVLVFAYLVNQKVLYPEASGLDNLVVIKLIKGTILSYLKLDISNVVINRIVTSLIYLLVILVIFIINLANNKIFKNKLNNTFGIGILALKQVKVYKIGPNRLL